MMAKRTVTWAMIGALFAAVGLWLWLRPKVDAVAKLPDGREVRLSALTYGLQHEFVYGPSATKWIARIIPESWANKLGITVVRRTFPSPALIAWLEWELPKGTPPPGEYISVVDEHRMESEPAGVTIRNFRRPWERLIGSVVTDFPRRERKIRLRVYSRNAAYEPVLDAELTGWNPIFKNYPQWSKASFPVRKEVGTRTFALENVTTGEPLNKKEKMQRAYIAPWSTAVFRVEENGQTTNAWAIESLAISDATGNAFTPERTTLQVVGDRLLFGFGKPFWASEQAWNFKAEFSRTSAFQPNELFPLRISQLPKRGEKMDIAQRFEMPAAWVTVNSIDRNLPQGSPTYGVPRWTAEIVLHVIPRSPGVALKLVRVADDLNKEVRNSPGYKLPNGGQSFLLALPDEANALEAEFAVQSTVFVDFPGAAPANAAK